MKAVDSIAEDLNSKNEDMDHFFQRFILWKSLNQIQCLKLETKATTGQGLAFPQKMLV